MATLTIDVPDDQLADLGGNPDEAGKAMRLAAAFHLCRQGQISMGRAARLAGLSYAEFLEEAARRQVDLFDYDLDEIKQETARSLPEGVNLEAIKQDIARAQSGRG